jgi:Uma2 family endonuclease
MSEAALKPLSFATTEILEDRDGLRYELWNGELVAMTGGSSAHNLIALGLRDVVRSQARPCMTYVADMALKLQPGAYSNKAYPDVMLVCEPLEGNYQTDPALLAEVLSDSSVKRDRNDKMCAYRALNSIEVYLIVSQTNVHIEVYRRANDWLREDYLGVEAVIELPQPQLTIPLRQVYADVLVLGVFGPNG